MNYRRIGKTDIHVSELGFGASGLGSVFGPIDEDEGCRAVRLALDSGITFFDVAPYYGDTRAETVLGKALHGIARNSYVLATKVGRYGLQTFDYTRDRILQSVADSMRRLGTGHLDILWCHDVEFGDPEQILNEALPTLLDLKREGITRIVGVSGLPLETLLHYAMNADIDAVLSYGHYTLADTALGLTIPLLSARGVSTVNAAPLGMGLFTSKTLPAWHPATLGERLAAARARSYCTERGVSLEKLALQFSVSCPGIVSTLVGCVTREEVESNVRALNDDVDPELMNAVRSLFLRCD